MLVSIGFRRLVRLESAVQLSARQGAGGITLVHERG